MAGLGVDMFVGASFYGGVGCFLDVFKVFYCWVDELFSFVLIFWFTQVFGSIVVVYLLSFRWFIDWYVSNVY